MRWRPRRIAGQIAILVVAAILATHALAAFTFVVLHPPEHVAADALPGASAIRLGSLFRLIAGTDPAARPGVVDAVLHATPVLARAAPGVPVDARPPGSEHPIVQELRRSLPGDVSARQIAGPAQEEVGTAVRVLVSGGGVPALVASLPADPRPKGPFLGPILITLSFLSVSLVLLSLWAARALAAPLDQLAAAADRFGAATDLAPLPERGPDEVMKVAHALARMRDRVKRLLDDRSQVLAAISHDLRTPITRMRLRAEFLDPETRRVTLRDLDQMNGMVEGALAFVRDGRPTEAVSRVDLASLAQTVADMFADCGHAVSYTGPDRLVAEARPDELQRALSNLVDNATKYGGRAEIALDGDSRAATFTVRDDGPGIPEADLQAVLEPFRRGDAARDPNGPAGFGLGLSIAAAVAERHGGRLTLSNRRAGGLATALTIVASREGSGPHASTGAEAVPSAVPASARLRHA